MAMYRIICLKRPAMKLVRQKQIVNQLLVLEFLTTAILLGFFFGASSIGDSGISVTTSICTGNSGEMDKIIQEATGKSGSLPIRLCFIFFLQSFVLAEFIIYISLFYQLYPPRPTRHLKYLQHNMSTNCGFFEASLCVEQ